MLAALLASLVLAASAAATPCVTATPACTDWVVLGGGPSRSMVYRTHPLDRRNEAITRVFVLIHGARRNADDYFHSAAAAGFLAGALDNTLIIAPRMASNDGADCRDALGQDEISWHCNTWRSGGPSLMNPAVTSVVAPAGEASRLGGFQLVRFGGNIRQRPDASTVGCHQDGY